VGKEVGGSADSHTKTKNYYAQWDGQEGAHNGSERGMIQHLSVGKNKSDFLSTRACQVGRGAAFNVHLAPRKKVRGGDIQTFATNLWWEVQGKISNFFQNTGVRKRVGKEEVKENQGKGPVFQALTTNQKEQKIRKKKKRRSRRKTIMDLLGGGGRKGKRTLYFAWFVEEETK